MLFPARSSGGKNGAGAGSRRGLGPSRAGLRARGRGGWGGILSSRLGRWPRGAAEPGPPVCHSAIPASTDAAPDLQGAIIHDMHTSRRRRAAVAADCLPRRDLLSPAPPESAGYGAGRGRAGAGRSGRRLQAAGAVSPPSPLRPVLNGGPRAMGPGPGKGPGQASIGPQSPARPGPRPSRANRCAPYLADPYKFIGGAC